MSKSTTQTETRAFILSFMFYIKKTPRNNQNIYCYISHKLPKCMPNNIVCFNTKTVQCVIDQKKTERNIGIMLAAFFQRRHLDIHAIILDALVDPTI